MNRDHCLSLAAIAHIQSQALYNSLLLTLPQHILQRENLQHCFSDILGEYRNNVGIEVTDHTSMFWKNTYQ